jgi:hypothetical protein
MTGEETRWNLYYRSVYIAAVSTPRQALSIAPWQFDDVESAAPHAPIIDICVARDDAISTTHFASQLDLCS